MIVEDQGVVFEPTDVSGPADGIGLKPFFLSSRSRPGPQCRFSAFDHGISRGRFDVNAKVVQSVVSASQQRVL